VSTERQDVIVIGAGMSGLAAAIRLAQFDQRVLVLEQHALPGGLNSFYKRRGRRLDTGLHAMTNFARKGARDAPLTKILRQLRIGYDELALGEQGHSRITLAGLSVRFSNDIALLCAEIEREFPGERDAFARLLECVRSHDPFRPAASFVSARAQLVALGLGPELAEVLLLPILCYGSALEQDAEWNDFVILFRSLFLEGFARPEGGIKRLLDILVARLAERGGVLRRNSTVAAILSGPDGVRGVRLEDGTEIECTHVLSSAGRVETARLAGLPVRTEESGWVTLFEALWILKRPSRELGCMETVHFCCTEPRVPWREPEGRIEPSIGIFCSSDNYATQEPPVEGMLRATAIANHDRWCELDEEAYPIAKRAACDHLADMSARLGLDPRPHAIDSDSFTPRTIRRYTGHARGAVYGSPHKYRDGCTPIPRLILIGNDQGLVGITGALLSGITMANLHLLHARAT
jgi:phytoene dehydrogenase-like protein